MVAKKRASKRVTLQKKYKIIKRTKEHHRKLKKGAILGSRKKKVDDNSIPNAWPYKEQLLKDIQAAKDRMEEVKLRQKEKRSEEMARRRAGFMDEVKSSTTKHITLSAPAEMDFDDDGQQEQEDSSLSLKPKSLGQNSRRAYLRELRKVVESADVVLHVLDARDPNGTRSKAIEEMVLSNYRKKLVYVLNKADLVPRDVLTGWLAHLRNSSPALPFKSNTQAQRGNLSRSSGKLDKVSKSGGLETNQAVGADELIGLLKNYARAGDSKTIIAVGIVGFPNVGKSSLINSLMRVRAVGVSPMPGFTKAMQEVVLDKNIRLIDSPGIVFADGDSCSTALRNCVNIEDMEDVMTPVQAIMEKCPQQYLMQLYAIPRFPDKDAMAFLALVARTTGRLKKGGVPNVDAAARAVLHDWNSGKIKFYCKAPMRAGQSGSSIEGESMILSAYSKELDIGSLLADESRILDTLEAVEEDDGQEYVSMDAVSQSHLESTAEIASSFTLGLASRAGAGATTGVRAHPNSNSDSHSVVSSRSGRSMAKPSAVGNGMLTAASSLAMDAEPAGASSLRKVQKATKKKLGKETRRGKKSGDGDEEVREEYDFNTDYD